MKLQLSYPQNTYIVSHKFGEPGQLYTSQGMLGHNGLDSFAQHGTPVYATHDGLASFQIDAGGGHGVVIITDQEFEGVDTISSYWKTIYWHLCDGLKEPQYASPFQGKTGFTKVSNGDLIGYADNTGASSGDHLHFGLKPVAKGENWGTWYNVQQTNGYLGAVDPTPYFDGSTPLQIQDLLKLLSLYQLLVAWWKNKLQK